MAKQKNIDFKKYRDVNSKEVITEIKKIKPDLIISALFSQILKKEIISIPRFGVINIHPAFLPDYKGVSPIFWSLLNREKNVGVTVHYIDEGIDTGKIIYREKIKIDPSDTEDSLFYKCIKRGSVLLVSAVTDIKKGRVKTISNPKGKYHSFPTPVAVKDFLKTGRRLVNFWQYLNWPGI